MQSTRFFDILTIILQPKGGCDKNAATMPTVPDTHNHPSAERRLRRRLGGLGLLFGLSQPSFSRKAVATSCATPRPMLPTLTTILQPKGGCDNRLFISANPNVSSQPSFSRKAVATHSSSLSSRSLILTTILQPKGGCDLIRAASLRYPSSQPSFSRKAVATASRRGRAARRPLTTILQPKGGCDRSTFPGSCTQPSHNHPSAERRLRRPTRETLSTSTTSQPSFSRKAVATSRN